MSPRVAASPRPRVPAAGFTLVEMLVVIAMIAMLAAILFPTFSRSKKKARQSNCISKLHSIGQAVKQYHLDKRHYPGTLTDLAKYVDFQVDAIGNLTAGADKLLCPEDLRPRTPAERISSFGGFSDYGVTGATCPPPPAANCNNPVNDQSNACLRCNPENAPRAAVFGVPDPTNPNAAANSQVTGPIPNTANLMQLFWNYWGYNNLGSALCRGNTGGCSGFQSPLFLYQVSLAAGKPLNSTHCGGSGPPAALAAPSCLPVGIPSWSAYPALANRTAPDNTIITHCWYHRPSWGKFDTANARWDENSVELILRLGGEVKTVKTIDMTGKWITQTD